MTSPSPNYTVITSTDALNTFCQSAKQACYDGDFLTLDTEFIREKTYYPQLCLVQAAYKDEAVIIDPMATSINLESLFTLLRDPKCRIVVHAGRQDFEIFYNLMGELPTNVFDTQIAGMVSGFGDSVGYETLVKSICKTGLDKTSRFSNWAQRPLTPKQLTYAIGDVTYLRDIYTYLNEFVTSHNRAHWIEEEMQTLLDHETYHVDFLKLLNKLKLRTNNSQVLARADALLRWRESEAESQDKPRQHIIRDELIAELATQNPNSKDEFKQTRGIRDKLLKHSTTTMILEALKKASSLSPADCPQLPKPENLDPIDPLTQAALKLILTYVAETSGVTERIIASAKDIANVVRDGDKGNAPCLKGWRYELFGETALKFLNKDLSISYDGKTIVLKKTAK